MPNYVAFKTLNPKEIMHHQPFPAYFHFQPYKSWEWYQDNFKYDHITGEVTRWDGYPGSFINGRPGPKHRAFSVKNPETGVQDIITAHEVAWCWQSRPPLKEGQEIDHRTGNGFDNSYANLRPATRSQQTQNQRCRSDSRTGLKGVQRVTKDQWQAKIKADGEYRLLGRFDCPAAASFAYQIAADNHFGEFAADPSRLFNTQAPTGCRAVADKQGKRAKRSPLPASSLRPYRDITASHKPTA